PRLRHRPHLRLDRPHDRAARRQPPHPPGFHLRRTTRVEVGADGRTRLTRTLRIDLSVPRRLGRAARFVWQSAPGWTVAGLALLVVQGLLPLSLLYLTKRLVDAVVTGAAAADRAAAFQHVLLLVAAAAAISLLDALCRAARSVVNDAQGNVV